MGPPPEHAATTTWQEVLHSEENASETGRRSARLTNAVLCLGGGWTRVTIAQSRGRPTVRMLGAVRRQPSKHEEHLHQVFTFDVDVLIFF